MQHANKELMGQGNERRRRGPVGRARFIARARGLGPGFQRFVACVLRASVPLITFATVNGAAALNPERDEAASKR